VLGGATRLVGLLGNPVAGSLSPRMHNAAFAARGLDWAYVALPVEPRSLEPAIRGLPALGFAGANVTSPHKLAALALCDELDGASERAGSVNTLVVRDGTVYGATTDGEAVIQTVDVAGARALVLGAGGAAHAVAAALVDGGAASVAVAARKPDRARALVARLRALRPGRELVAFEVWPPPSDVATLIVNATPIRDEAVVDPQANQAVVDLAYRVDGRPTAFVAGARERGCRAVVDGLEILVRQGAASFERWTGVRAPVQVMRSAVRMRG
jgi:shikimate dehydrogenase